MCGLIFLYKDGVDSEGLTMVARKALKTIEHRGPDDSGIHATQTFVMGHRRLAIVDLKASTQPMLAVGGRYSLAFNGEIYNYRALRAELSSRWNFETNGDTETLLAGLVIYGVGFLNRMEGMWAFAFWDQKERSLLLSRDRMGKKPLYYQMSKTGLSSASELSALRVLSETEWREDSDSTADYLQYGYFMPGTTAYRSVKEVLPGHFLLWRPNKKLQIAAYWKLTVSRFECGLYEAGEQIREKMIQSVKRRMVADVEVGAFLSGGIDSSIVTAIMAKYCCLRPKTFTIGFLEKSYDERHYARIIAEKYHTDHFEECMEDWDRDQLKNLVLNHIGQPFSDSSLLPTAMVSELASRHVKVALSGDGGDELFGGYYRYEARTLLRWYTRLPSAVRKGVKKLVHTLSEPDRAPHFGFSEKALQFLDVTDRMDCETPYVAPVNYSSENLFKLVPDLVDHGHSVSILPAETALDDIQSMMVADALIYLPQDVLVKVDRASMAHSLEIRAPFLDSELIDLAFSIPRTWHRRYLTGKRMLKQSLGDLLPELVWRRRKQGFGVPIHHWFRRRLGDELEQLLADHDGPVRTQIVREMLDIHRKGICDHGYRLWNIYIYLLWRTEILPVNH